MTARQIFEATLIELSKVQAPALKLYEFNYLFNKAINQYVNKVYTIYDLNQQTTDDLRVLKATAFLEPTQVAQQTEYASTTYLGSKFPSLNGAAYEVVLPPDYLHLLNCICVYQVTKQKDCWDAGTYIQIPATRLTADAWSLIVTDIYNRPSPMKPYYYIHNQNTQNTYIANNGSKTGAPVEYNTTSKSFAGVDTPSEYKVTSNGAASSSTSGTIMTYPDPQDTIARSGVANSPDDTGKANSNLPRTIKLKQVDSGGKSVDTNISLVEKPIATRVSNVSQVRMEIRYGRDNSLFELKEVQVDYIKSPQYIRLTQEQIDLTEDTSQMMEFPDYVNQEIINELVHLIMEHSNDPRLSNNIQMTNSIARPTGQQAQAQA